jgi:iron complex outermembrane receptor protein
LNLIRLIPAEGASLQSKVVRFRTVEIPPQLVHFLPPLVLFLFFVLPCLSVAPARAADELEEIVVTAGLHAIVAEQMPGSVTILDAATLHDAGQQHFEDVLALIPNFNWAGDTSRPRYFQIRGIGELQQYQGAPNPSVGFLIDDIDFSGIGAAATLFDVDHVEVLHGPQSTIYGANALAGLIYVKSADPSDSFGGRVELDAGDYHSQSYGAVLTGPIDALDSSFRLAVQRATGNGFYYNAYLHRDTNERNELTARARWRYDPSDQLRIDFSLLRVQIDNGYDAFSIDNTRTMQSDQPGMDVQNSTGVSLRAAYSGFDAATLTSIVTYADSVIRYSYDGDWGNPLLWAPYTYQYNEAQVRYRSTRSLELRLGDTPERGFAWLVGVYGFRLREALSDTSAGIYVDPFDSTQNSQSLSVLTSHYDSGNLAAYAEIDGDLGPRARWSIGARGERHTGNYDDQTTSLGAPNTTNAYSPSDDLWGGHVSLDYLLARNQHVYALVARGYKASGFNLSQGLPANERVFSAESDLNFEAGYKALLAGGSLRWTDSLFYLRRSREQLLTGTQLDPNNPNTFIFYTGNASAGYNWGVESALSWRATHRLEFGASVGLLQTRYHGFVQDGVVLPDRALPDAPHWQAALNATWRDARGPYLRVDLTGMGSYYFDLPPNSISSSAYGLVNAKLGWETSRWEVDLWGRNLLDKNYPVRGFYFADEPPNFPNKTYVQLGDPRTCGIHITLRF